MLIPLPLRSKRPLIYMDHLNCPETASDLSECNISGWKTHSYCLDSDMIHLHCITIIYGHEMEGIYRSIYFMEANRFIFLFSMTNKFSMKPESIRFQI